MHVIVFLPFDTFSARNEAVNEQRLKKSLNNLDRLIRGMFENLDNAMTVSDQDPVRKMVDEANA
jgi:hypothetical protein